MKLETENPSRTRVEAYKKSIEALALSPVNVMEVCGTHTVAIARSGLRSLLPRNLRLLSGPGCPVCVTSAGDIDRIIFLAEARDVDIVTFGDMLRVPGSKNNLEYIRAVKGNVHIVYSPDDALKLAEENPERQFVFAGVGFETTAPSIAAVVLAAKAKNIKNLSVAPLFKLVPPALKAILGIKQRKIDGFLLPGHVSTVIGSKAYNFVADEYRVPGVISGFSAEDILESLAILLTNIREGRPRIQNQYVRSVTEDGNSVAQNLLKRVFKQSDAEWRAIGILPGSGLVFADEFEGFDAFRRFDVPVIKAEEPKGCRCGEILLGLCGPMDCSLFSRICTPSLPIGPCMVSSEGACAAQYNYGITDNGK